MTEHFTSIGDVMRKAGQLTRATFVVTERCNYRCTHCYQDHEGEGELTTREVVRILGELADAGVLFLDLMGGEVFARSDADEILREAHRLGFAINLKTTGHFIHDRRADLLASLRPLTVDLSLYAGDPGRHDRVTCQEGSWQRTVDAARRLIARKVKTVFRATVMEWNAREMDGLVALANDVGAEFGLSALVQGMTNTDPATTGLRMSAETARSFYATDEVTRGLADRFARLDELRREKHDGASLCGAGFSMSISPTGEVWPCNLIPIRCGDLRQQSVAEVWQRSVELANVRSLRYGALKDCNVCQLRPYCERCHAMALLEQGDISGPSLEACRLAVAKRDALRDKGLIPETETALPPTWDRVDPDGLHHLPKETNRRRPASLRVIR